MVDEKLSFSLGKLIFESLAVHASEDTLWLQAVSIHFTQIFLCFLSHNYKMV